MRVEGVRGTKAVKAAANAASGVNATGGVSDMVHLWVRPNRAFMNGYFGIRCRTKHPDCVVCVGWAQFDSTGTGSGHDGST